MHTLVAPFVNLAILVALLATKLRAPIVQFVSQRHASLRDELMRVREQLRGAQVKYDEFSAKLNAIDAELRALREQSKQDGLAMKTRIAQEARKLSAQIVSDARSSSESLYGEFKRKLTQELGARVLGRAEVLLRERLTGDDKIRIQREFSQQMESMQ